MNDDQNYDSMNVDLKYDLVFTSMNEDQKYDLVFTSMTEDQKYFSFHQNERRSKL